MSMDPIATMQAWTEKYELITSDIALERDPGSENTFKYTITGYLQPKCNCRETTSIAELAAGVRTYIPGSTEGCFVHGVLAHRTSRIYCSHCQQTLNGPCTVHVRG